MSLGLTGRCLHVDTNLITVSIPQNRRVTGGGMTQWLVGGSGRLGPG